MDIFRAEYVATHWVVLTRRKVVGRTIFPRFLAGDELMGYTEFPTSSSIFVSPCTDRASEL